MDAAENETDGSLPSDVHGSALVRRSTRRMRLRQQHQQHQAESQGESGHYTNFASDTQSSTVVNPRDRSKVHIQTVFSADALHRVFALFTGEKKEIAESIGFGGLLKLHPQVKFPRMLVLWLVRNMDADTGTIMLKNGEKLPVTDKDVQLVLGLPQTHKPVECSFPISTEVISTIRNILMLGPDEEITLECLKIILLHDYGSDMSVREIEAFKVALVLYVDAYFMGPKGAKVKVNQEIFKNMTDTDCIGKLNWCGYVLRLLLQSARRVQKSIIHMNKTVTLDGCLLFWVVFYLDNVEFGVLDADHNVLPRVVEYPSTFVRMLERDDCMNCNASGMRDYGRNKLRQSESVVYSRNKGIQGRQNENVQEVKFNPSNTTSDVMMDNITKAINNWELQVSKATNESREMMLGFLNSVATNFQEGDNGKMLPVLGKDTIYNADIDSSKPSSPNELLQGQHEHQHQAQDHKIDQVEHDIPVCEYERNYGVKYYIISDSEDSENQNFHPGFDGIGRSPSERKSYSWSTDQEIENEEQLRLDLENFAMECGSNSQQMLVPHVTDETNGGDNGNIIAANELTEDQKMVINDIVVDVTSFRNQSRFSVSPFTIGLGHKDAPLEAQMKLYEALRQVSDEDKKSMWYIHDNPTMLQIGGELLQGMFGSTPKNTIYDLTTKTMNAIMRLYHQMDDEIYARWSEKRWRHFLPADFAIAAFRGHGYLTSEEVSGMFQNYNITYRVDECRLVLAPLLLHWYWCLYVWDFQRNTLVVLDPISKHLGGEHMAQKHRRCVEMMHQAVQECMDIYFSKKNGSMQNWDVEYLTVAGAPEDGNNSGFYTLFYARHFDGQYMTRILTQESIKLQKCSMLYQLLTMYGNMGETPKTIMDAINVASSSTLPLDSH